MGFKLFTKESLEGKLYGVMCLLTASMSYMQVVVNLILGISPFFNFILFLFAGLFTWFYFDFKKNKITKVKYGAFVFALIVIVTIAWFFNNGLVGGMAIVYTVFQLAMLLISNVRYIWYVTIGLISHFSILYAVQNIFPEYILPYESVLAQEVDMYITSLLVLSFGGYIVWRFKQAYEKERVHLRRSRDLQERARKEAERFSKLQTDFLANMSHEIRTPLNGIIGNSELLLNLDKEDNPEDYIKTIAHSGQLLLSLVNNILDLSKLEANRLELSRVPFNLRELINQVEGVFVALAQEKAIYIDFLVDQSVPLNLIGDPSQVKQVLVNLIGNAVKFTKKGGVSISVVCTMVDDDVDLFFKVNDTGIGISSESQKHIFDRFYQVNQDLSREFQGTGLGLIIAKNLVELMGGSISLESYLGKGSCFSFNMKLKKGEDKIVSLIKEYEGDLPDLKILIAEDNEINQMLLKKQLSNFKYDVDIASNGLEAIAMLKRQSYDLILMDVQMPELDGVSATKIIRGDQELHQPIIIALTANAMKDDKDKCMAVGMNDYLSKPISVDDLKQTLIKWFC